jgi:hypothetical protein
MWAFWTVPYFENALIRWSSVSSNTMLRMKAE